MRVRIVRTGHANTMDWVDNLYDWLHANVGRDDDWKVVDAEPGVVIINIVDPDKALVFKLTWNGQVDFGE